jgi:hypothetical protein
MTPGWRKHCIHCGKRITPGTAQNNRAQQRPSDEAIAAS